MVPSSRNIVKAVVASAMNENGEQLFPRTWNEEFIDAPLVKHQKQPSTDKKGMENILKEATGRYRVLYALLAGCGPLRAGEALGLEIGKHISEDWPHALYSPKGEARRNPALHEDAERRARRGSVYVPCSDAQGLHRNAHFRAVVLHIHQEANPTNRYPSRQPPSHPEKAGTRKGWVQYLPALPHHRAADGRVS